MARKYISNREKIQNFLLEVIIPIIKKEKDLDYEKIINETAMHLGVSKNSVEENLRTFIDSNIIKEMKTHVLTIPDKEVEGYFEAIKAKHDEIKKDIEENLEIK